MHKLFKPLFLGLVVAILGAVPASASAGILQSGGSEVAVGTQISGQQTGSTVKFYSGSSVYFECSQASLAATVTKNSSSAVESSLESLTFTGAEGGCPTLAGNVKISLESTACLRHTTASSPGWIIRGAICTVAPNTAHFNVSGAFTCRYALESESGSLSSNINSEPLLIQDSRGMTLLKESGGALCPPSLQVKSINLLVKTASGQGLKVTA